MKVLVTGADGQLGHDLVIELEKRGHTAIPTDIAQHIRQLIRLKKMLKCAETLTHREHATLQQAATDLAVR